MVGFSFLTEVLNLPYIFRVFVINFFLLKLRISYHLNNIISHFPTYHLNLQVYASEKQKKKIKSIKITKYFTNNFTCSSITLLIQILLLNQCFLTSSVAG